MSTPFDMLQRLSALIDEEAAALNSGNLAVIKDINFRKSHVLLELSRAGDRLISHQARRLHDLGRRRRNRPLVLRRKRRRKGARLLSAAVASSKSG